MKKFKFYVDLFENVCEEHKGIDEAKFALIDVLSLNECECDMRQIHAADWVPRGQVIVESNDHEIRIGAFIGRPYGRYGNDSNTD